MSEESIEKLIASIRSGTLEERREAVKALAGFGPDCIPALILVLETGDNDSRWYASRALVKVGPSCIDDLIEAARTNSDHDLRRYVAGVLVAFGEGSIDILIDLLGDPDPNVRGIASMALRKIGAPAVPMLLQIAETSDPGNTRGRAAFLTLINMDCVDQGQLSGLMKS